MKKSDYLVTIDLDYLTTGLWISKRLLLASKIQWFMRLPCYYSRKTNSDQVYLGASRSNYHLRNQVSGEFSLFQSHTK